MNFFEFSKKFASELDCIKYFIKIRYNNKPVCKHCGSCEKIYHKASFPKMFDCKFCGSSFSIFAGTMFEKSDTDLRKWFYAIHLFLNGKKGISALQLQREIGVTYKCAWRILHKIREAMSKKDNNDDDNDGGMLQGIIEIDECYIGGKSANKHMKKRIEAKEKDDKAVVLGIVNQETKQVKSFHIKNSQYPQIAEKIIDNIEIGSTIITDEANVYKALGKYYYKHNSINHSKGEYVKNESCEAFIITTNAVEGMFGLLKRGIDGIFHWVSKKHLQKYLNEFNFRYNTKDLQDNERFVSFLNNVSGRLRYCELVG
jgi:transposase-like protein